MRRLLLLLSAAAALLAAAAVAGVGRPEAARGDSTTQQNVVTTTGRGTVTTVPDVATVSVGVLDAAAAAGANTLDGPMLERSDTDALYREALGKALRDARAKAEALAKAGGFSVGRVVNVSEAAAEPVPVRAEFTALQAKAD